jgi:hypothetical protein
MSSENKNNNFEQLDYKDLQKKCKEHKLKAVGKKDDLVFRLKNLFISDQNSNTNESEKINTKDNNNSLMSEIKYEKVDPTTVYFVKSEMKTILEIGIIVSNELRNKYKNNDKNDISINKIIFDYSEIMPECKIKTRRKVLFINAIVTLFEDEINTSKNKKHYEVLDELIKNGKETYSKMEEF